MSIRHFASAAIVTGLTVASGFGIAPAYADDTEVFFSITTETGDKANVLFILDTSQSMFALESTGESEEKGPYDSAETYGGACDPGKYYWTTSGGSTPTCEAGWAGLDDSQFACDDWRAAAKSANGGVTRTSRMAQKNAGNAWVTITAHPDQQPWQMACEVSGSLDAPANWKLKNKGKDVYPSGAYTFYSGNWLNWNATDGGGGEKYRIDIVREAVARLVENTDDIRVGLMRFGYDGDREFKQNAPDACEVLPDADEATKSSNGAPVVFPVTDLDGSPVDGMPGATVREQIRYQLGVGVDGENLGWVVNPGLPDASQPYQIAKGGGSTCPIPLMTPGGRSPIGGAMMEAYLYYSGSQWSLKYGKQAAIGSTFGYPSVPQSRVDGGDFYDSPIVDNCSKNFIVLLSDGTTEQDNDIDGPVAQLKDYDGKTDLLPKYTGLKACDTESYLTETPPPSMCVDDMAEIMYEHDMSSSVPGLNNVITYTVGFKLGTDDKANAARSMLKETASRGGGEFYEAESAQSLEDVLTEIARQILTENSSFSAPAVTVNAFNRTQNLNDLYMSLFRPSFDYRWYGNIKKYRLEPDGDIVDKDGDQAVDPATGFFRNTAWSYWSDVEDGADVTLGGAAGEIDYASRKVYTNITGTSNVTLSDFAGNNISMLDDSDADAAATALGIQPSDTVTAAQLIDWIRGKDIDDADGDSVTDESRKDMGDPLHAKPVTVIYGGSVGSPNLDDAAIFAVTNDGFLHAINPVNGQEYWSFVPSNLLERMRNLYVNKSLVDPNDRVYGLDGNIRVLRIDNNRNGIIEPTKWVDVDLDGEVDDDENIEYDRVFIFFGQRRGGPYYYALDVTYKTAPKLLWMREYQAQGAGQSWSSPTPATVRIDDTVKKVLVFGAGYDTGQDQIGYREDIAGRGIFMVDALTGAMLWRAGASGSAADLELPGMKYSIVADVRVIDLTGDGFADRMYATDLGGQIWRFDIVNGKPVAGVEGDRLVEGGLFASLGEAGGGPFALENSIRFFYAPDPALVQFNGSTFINVAVGSGHREFPVSDKVVQNWFYSVRDYAPFGVLLSSQYQSSACVSFPCHQTVTEDDLVDITDLIGADATAAVPVGAPDDRSAGWKLELPDDGEKVLAESRTFPIKTPTGQVKTSVVFSTYSPVEKGLTDDQCGITFGLNKLYAVSAVDARPVNNWDQQAGESVADRSKELAQGSIAPEVVLVFPTPDVDPNDPASRRAPPPVCLVGLESCGTSVANPPVRTYWKQRGAN